MANNPLPPNVTRISPSAGSASKEASPAIESAKALPLALVPSIDFSAEKLALLKLSAGCKDLFDDEFRLFVEMCERRRLDPFCRQVYAIVRGGKDGRPRSVSWQTSIDAFRLIASRSGEYEGQEGPFWCDANGKWTRAWLTRSYPAAARVGVYRRGFRAVLWGVVRFEAYAQLGGGMGIWERMADNQLAKCAEALALRKAFPEDLGGIYAAEEMDQASEELVGEVVHVDQPPAPAPNVVQAPAPPAPAAAPMLTAEQSVIESYAAQFASVRNQRELDGLSFEVRRAAGERTSPEFKKWFLEMRKQAEGYLGTQPKGVL